MQVIKKLKEMMNGHPKSKVLSFLKELIVPITRTRQIVMDNQLNDWLNDRGRHNSVQIMTLINDGVKNSKGVSKWVYKAMLDINTKNVENALFNIYTALLTARSYTDVYQYISNQIEQTFHWEDYHNAIQSRYKKDHPEKFKIESILERVNADNVVGEIKLFWNGFKINNSKLWKCWVRYDAFNDKFEYHNGERRLFDKTAKSFFSVIDNSNVMRDYFERDYFSIYKGSKYYNAAKSAYEKKYGKIPTR